MMGRSLSSNRIGVVDIPLNVTAINEVVEVPEVPNLLLEENLREMDVEWLQDTIVDSYKM